jgi:flagellar assembly protein FliH
MEASQQIGSTAQQGIAGRPVAYEYLAWAGAAVPPQWAGWGTDDMQEKPVHAAPASPDGIPHAEVERRLGEETRRSFEAGRERGRQEGRQGEREAQSAADQQRKLQTASLIENFALERDRYFVAVEREVVELALGVAARILRREAQMDPLLLTGAVRVALGQLCSTTQARLRVPPAELDLWTEAIGLLPNLALKPAVVPGEGMRLGDCAIETELGSVDIGIRAQLSEIERGFFDRAGAKPGPAAAARVQAGTSA